jgi:hypothetical protein
MPVVRRALVHHGRRTMSRFRWAYYTVTRPGATAAAVPKGRRRSPRYGPPTRRRTRRHHYAGLTLVAVQSGDGRGRVRRPLLAGGDILILRGDVETVGGLASDRLLAFRTEVALADVAQTLFNRSSGLAES